MVRKKQKVIPERHRIAKPTPATSRDGSQSEAAEEPPGVTNMEIPLPTTPQASRPETPENAGPTFKNCNKLQELATLIDVYSTTLENTHSRSATKLNQGSQSPTHQERIELHGTDERETEKSERPTHKLLHPTTVLPLPQRQELPSSGLIASSTQAMTSSRRHAHLINLHVRSQQLSDARLLASCCFQL
ncbi:hypothetical protein TNCV_3399801 [Trichonephila clavipes]|nr:hypothetical protein TNCV_3399801 [Trichonephila clavipes]